MGSDKRVSVATGGEVITPDMAAADGYRIVLARLAATATLHLPGAIEGVDPAHLHQLRVAVRRTRALLADTKPVLGTGASARRHATGSPGSGGPPGRLAISTC